MPNAAHRRRVQALATGAIAMVAAATQAMPAQADDTQHSKHNDKTLNNAHPAWATADKDRGAVPASQTITTRVFLTGQDDAGLAALAKDVNDPNSPNYGKFLTPEQVKQQFGATPAQVAAVQQWLKDSGLTVTSASTNWIDAKGPAEAVQRAFGTQLKNYQRPDGSVGYAASSAAVVPGAVANYVSAVSGLSQNTMMAHTDSVKKPVATPNNTVTPNAGAQSWCGAYWGQSNVTGLPATSNATTPLLPCPYTAQDLRSAYGLTKTGKGATIAVVDWYAAPNMIDAANQWSSHNGVPAFRSGQYSEYYNQGAWNNTDACPDAGGEEALDVEMAHGLAPDANVVYVGANSCTDADLMAAEQQIVDQHLADVVSNSWGAIMHGKDGDQDPAVMAQYDRIFQKGAAEGISFTFSTGDCGDDDPANKAGGAVNCNGNSARRQTEWPVSSQWVTAVGGTTLATNSGGGYAWEVAMGDHRATLNGGSWSSPPGHLPFFFGGGGGTSEDITQPWYQAGKVPAGLANTTSAGVHTTRPMRVLPDVAMNGSLATMVQVDTTEWDGANNRWLETSMGGTSVAAPEFAAVLADTKEAAGHAVGFANPSLYALNSSAYHDVTSRPGITEGVFSGGSKSELYQVGMDTSLTATPGYDNATGLGSPNAGFVDALAAQKPPVGNPAGPAVSRVAGATRYETAIAVSKQAFPAAGSAPAVVLAVGENFPDALAGVPFAKSKNAPLLLTPSKGMDAGVAAEIKRVLAPGGKVYVLGGVNAVSPAAVNALKLPASQIQRIAGATRYETSVAIAQAMGNPKNVVVATGKNFPDALAAGPYASDVFSAQGTGPAAILLTEDTVVPKPVYDYIMNNKVDSLAAIGGQAVTAVSSWGPTLKAFKGSDRFETAAMVAKAFPYPQIAGVATGMQFADALTGAALLARSNSPLLLTMPGALPDTTKSALQGLAHSLAGGGFVDIFGGPVAVSNAVVNQVAAAVGGHVK
ncbi:cell wall-binding repeat-containing protein [Catenulispora subtropica]|uniref:Peptidase S53 domain-containing protein n=1 Tax=Catenulispora subtropica TaxID=450798 RepID=A0ABP5DD38_9ACTN